jgi:hypothetical protein
MKAKINRGGGFRGALNYVFGKAEVEKVRGNMSGQTVVELTREFAVTKKLRPDCKNPVWHCSLALPEGDRLSAQKWDELSVDFMCEMGLDPANHLYEVVRHSDTKHDHIHIVASRIGLDGALWHGQNDVYRAIEATQKLEQRHRLTLTAGFDPEVKKDRKTLTAQEINMGVREETKPPRMVCQEAVDAVLQTEGVMSAPLFIECLAAFDVRAVPSVANTGTMNGFSFETAGVAFTGSKLGASYKWAELQKRGVEYVKTRDFEKLADAKRAAAERVRNQEPGAVAPAGGRASDAGHGPAADAERGREHAAGGLRPGDPSAALQPGRHGEGNDPTRDLEHGDQGRGAGQERADVDQPGAAAQVLHQRDGGQQPSDTGTAAGADQRSGEGRQRDAEQRAGSGDAGAAGAPEHVDNADPDAGRGNARGDAGGGWASRFKQANAPRPHQGVRTSERSGAGRVVEPDRVITAREIDPTGYLEAQGFQVIREGRHLSVRLHGDEVYRCTRKDDGHWVTCDLFENGIGDNIALVQELEPGTSFADSVYRLSGAPSVSRAARSAPAPVVRQTPQMPAYGPADVQRGRGYLQGRGIGLETIETAEAAGMLRYSAGGVLFVGWDDNGVVQNIMRRATDASEATQKRDLRGTDKRHPQMLLGAPDAVLIVEGGTDALAAVDMARRKKRPVPTVLVSGGANVRSWIETPWVQRVLRLAQRVIVAFEREDTPEKQVKTDAAHQAQMERLRQVCGADVQVKDWMPPEGVKDLAELNWQQVQAEAAQAVRRAEDDAQRARGREEAGRPRYPTPRG